MIASPTRPEQDIKVFARCVVDDAYRTRGMSAVRDIKKFHRLFREVERLCNIYAIRGQHNTIESALHDERRKLIANEIHQMVKRFDSESNPDDQQYSKFYGFEYRHSTLTWHPGEWSAERTNEENIRVILPSGKSFEMEVSDFMSSRKFVRRVMVEAIMPLELYKGFFETVWNGWGGGIYQQGSDGVCVQLLRIAHATNN